MMQTLHYVANLDIWSKSVAARDKRCRFLGCKRTFGLGAHHIFRRNEHALRMCLENGILVCAHHHEWLEKNKSHKETYFSMIVSLIGKELLDLLKREMKKISDSRRAPQREKLPSSEIDI